MNMKRVAFRQGDKKKRNKENLDKFKAISPPEKIPINYTKIGLNLARRLIIFSLIIGSGTIVANRANKYFEERWKTEIEESVKRSERINRLQGRCSEFGNSIARNLKNSGCLPLEFDPTIEYRIPQIMIANQMVYVATELNQLYKYQNNMAIRNRLTVVNETTRIVESIDDETPPNLRAYIQVGNILRSGNGRYIKIIIMTPDSQDQVCQRDTFLIRCQNIAEQIRQRWENRSKY